VEVVADGVNLCRVEQAVVAAAPYIAAEFNSGSKAPLFFDQIQILCLWIRKGLVQ